MSSGDPIRLRAGGSDELRALLRSAAGDAPTAAEVDTLTAALAPAVKAAGASIAAATVLSASSASAATASASAAGSATATAAGLGLKAWLLAAAIGAATVGGTIAWTRAGGARSPEVTTAPAVAIAPTTAPSPTVMPPTVAPPALPAAVTPAPPTEVASAPSPPRVAAAPRRPRAVVPAPTVSPAVPPAPEVVADPEVVEAPPAAVTPPTVPAPPPAAAAPESELLRGAKAALLRGDATQALALTATHATHYPGGQFVEEREAIAVEALVALGRTSAADDRFQRFRARYPQSSYLARLQRIVSAGASR